MQYYGKAEEAANDILEAFKHPNGLPKPLAQVFIHRKDQSPCRSWSWRNQLIVTLHSFSEARGFRQWENIGRRVMKGEKAFRILSPVTKKKVDEKTGEEKDVFIGFKGTPVFGLEQTEGEPLPEHDPAVEKWIASLPLIEVAESWGLAVEAFSGRKASHRGYFRPDAVIALGVKNLSTWTHELVHAADHKNGSLKELGQHWRSETVAELGGAVLLHVLGYDHEADLGGCWDYIQWYAKQEGLDILDACGKVLNRTCDTVALILDTAEELAVAERISPA